MNEQIKVGDLVARNRTRKIVKRPTDEKDVPFKISKIRGCTAIGEDGNNHFINNLSHVNN